MHALQAANEAVNGSSYSTLVYAFSAGVAAMAIAAERAAKIFRDSRNSQGATPPANGNGKYVTTREFDARTEGLDKRFDLTDQRLGRIEDKLDRALGNA